SRITYEIAKRLVSISHIGLLNVVAGREVAPEFVQEAFTTQAVADALQPLFGADSPARTRMLDGMADVRRLLGAPGAAGRVAEMAAAMLPADGTR
ncbi:MAG: lipid-A-disaccharide synthase, partial [Gemmatimonadaceae bacterium]